MKKLVLLTHIFFVLLFISCNQTANKNVSADTIYFGGDILTMEGDSAVYAEAIATKNGKIIFVGTKAAAEDFKGDSTIMYDLKGKTLLPGFIDAHSHITMGADAINQANINPAPVGNINSISDNFKIDTRIKSTFTCERYQLVDWLGL